MAKTCEIIKKQITKRCGCTHRLPNKQVACNPDCQSCEGHGELEDGIYFHIVNGICVDGDTVK